MRWDYLIRGAKVFDGSAGNPRQVDVAVSGNCVAQLGAGLPVDAAKQVIDGSGKWLMPGLIDIHTHYDLEVELEPQLPEAVRHGTTTALVANCSLGLAFGNQRNNGADPIVDCFARVENVPKDVLRKVADACNWADSGEYLDHFDRLALGPNIVPMIPHSMLRIEVMGLQDSVTRDPTDDELRQMSELLEKGMRQGYVGFSTDGLPFHYLANQPNTHKQIPTQFAPFSELKTLTGIVRRWGRVWQATPPKDDKKAVIRNFLLTSGRLYGKTLKVTAVAALDVATDRSIKIMGILLSRILNSRLVKGHFRMQALAAPFKTWSDGVVTPLAEEIPELRRLNELDLDDREGRLKILNDPQWVQAFRRMWLHGRKGFSLARIKRWLRLDHNVLSRELSDMHIESCPHADWNGQTMQRVFERLCNWQISGHGAMGADEESLFASFPNPCDDADFFLHLLRRFDTDLRWWCVTANVDPKVVKHLLFHPLLLPGFNDSGAHITNMAFFDANLRTLKIAQEDGDAKVAQAVHRLSREPADFLGVDAGRLEQGARADLVLVDPEKLREWNPDDTYRFQMRECFAHKQLVNRPDGVVSSVLLNGQLAWNEGAYTRIFGQQRLGRVLRHKDHHAQMAAA
ncbi:MAG: N-acyl-D-amino-acid deacylase family protein [Panacagrimonas sp.]